MCVYERNHRFLMFDLLNKKKPYDTHKHTYNIMYTQ